MIEARTLKVKKNRNWENFLSPLEPSPLTQLVFSYANTKLMFSLVPSLIFI